MNHTKIFKILTVLFAVVLCFGPVGLAAPVGTAFTYQGRLIDANKAADGLYDFQFKLFDANSAGNKLGQDINEPNIDVIDGYFTVGLDFGNVFDGNDRWLQIGVRPGVQNDPNVYTVLSPRQEITPTPYALYAKTAGADSDWIISGNDMYSGVLGKVGIGTTEPTATLHIYKNNEPGITVDSSAGGSNALIRLISPSGTWNLFSRAGGDYFGIGLNSADNKFAINNSGNVGIGTTSPGTKLHVYEPSSSDVYMSVEASSSNAEAGVRLKNPAGGWDVFANDDDGDFGIAHALSDRVLTIKNSTGNVGIGTTEPTATLHIYKNNEPGITIDSSAGGSNALIRLISPSGNWNLFSRAGGDYFGIGLNSADNKFVIKNSGNVGIGTTEPTATLHIYKNNEPGITIDSSAGGSNALIRLISPSGTWNLFSRAGGNYFGIGLNSADNKFVINNSGNVGIGTDSPQRNLHVSDVMRLQPRAAAPGSPVEGDIYMNSSTHKLMVYDGTTWQACW